MARIGFDRRPFVVIACRRPLPWPLHNHCAGLRAPEFPSLSGTPSFIYDPLQPISRTLDPTRCNAVPALAIMVDGSTQSVRTR